MHGTAIPRRRGTVSAVATTAIVRADDLAFTIREAFRDNALALFVALLPFSTNTAFSGATIRSADLVHTTGNTIPAVIPLGIERRFTANFIPHFHA